MARLEELILELTDWCPLNCKHCSSSSGTNCNNILDEKLTIQLINQAAELGVKKVSFGGGEPTAAKIFIPALKRIVKLGLAAEVFTCGVNGSPRYLTELTNEIAVNFKNEKAVKFIFSIHGFTSRVHDSITQVPQSFGILINSLKNFIKFGIQCEVNFVPLKSNIHQFADLVRFIDNWGIRKMSILRFVPQGRGFYNQNDLELSKEKESLFIENLLLLRKKARAHIRTGSPFNDIIPNNNVFCRAGYSKLVIQADGNVLPCEVFKHNERCKWGLSIYNQSLSEVLQSKVLEELYVSIQQHNCLRCPIHSVLRKEKERRVNYAVSQCSLYPK